MSVTSTLTSTSEGGRSKQGLHPDPADRAQPPPDHRTWPLRGQQAFSSLEMDVYRAALLSPGVSDVRQAVLDDLSSFYGFDKEECVSRCLNWEEWSVNEWHSTKRGSAEAVTEFYQSVHSWSFDLLWYAYLQAAGYAYPVSVAIAQGLPKRGNGRRLLDFGAGVGTTGQFFQRLGYEVDLADISTTLQAFARFRLERRGQSARFIDLNTEAIEPNQYDVITAVDTLVHVPAEHMAATLRSLHRALKPGGLLFANFDTRPMTPENAWHLYRNLRPLQWQLQRSGFEPEENLDWYTIRYRKVDTASLTHKLHGARDAVLLRSPLRPAYHRARWTIQQALQRRRTSH